MLGAGLRLFMLEWSRAAEITCDRAGAICAGGVMPMMTALAKLKTGGEQSLSGINVEEYVRQFDQAGATPLKLAEFLQTHPLTQKRIAALKVFEEGDVLRSWLPHLDTGVPARRRQDVDRACEAIVKVVGGHVGAK